MKRIKDIKPNIFSAIYKVNADLQLFKYATAENLDTYYNVMYSQRIASSPLEYIDVETLGALINGMYGAKWDALIDTVTRSFTLLSKGGSEVVTMDRSDGKGTTRTTEEGVSPYNDDDYANRNKTISTESGADTVKYTRTTVDDRTTNVDFSALTLYLTKANVFDTIYADVNRVLTLPIY